MAVLTVSRLTRDSATGVDIAGVAAAAGGDTFANDGQTLLNIFNGGGSPITLTVVTPATVEGLAVADRTYSIPASGRRVIGPFRPSLYNDAGGVVGGNVSLTYSAVTSVTVVPVSYPID
jgi:hypothetical protein